MAASGRSTCARASGPILLAQPAQAAVLVSRMVLLDRLNMPSA